MSQKKIKKIANIIDSRKKMIETDEISVLISFVEEFIKICIFFYWLLIYMKVFNFFNVKLLDSENFL
jgi:hypothetical protein